MDNTQNFPIVSKLKHSNASDLKKILRQNADNALYESLIRKNSSEIFAVVDEIHNCLVPPKWPAECQVLEGKIYHAQHAPLIPEPFYSITGKEEQPKFIGDKRGKVVYDYPVSPISNFRSSAAVVTCQSVSPVHPEIKKETLRFESRFESGNLAKAIRIHEQFYELYLRKDLYTDKHVQWFYFKVTNMKKRLTYRFSIVNLSREQSLYRDGLKPLMYSVKDSVIRNKGWIRCGSNLSYYTNQNELPNAEPDESTYILSFTVQFPYDNDVVFFAYAYPYTYSDLQSYLGKLLKHPKKSRLASIHILCKTLAGNNVYCVTVTAPRANAINYLRMRHHKVKRRDPLKKKKVIIVTARVHPCETPSSWIMKGILDFLTSNSATANQLREKYIFKLIPMLNPDGVIVGNSRCSLAGRDLNRQFRNAMRNAFPSIWYTKLLIERMLLKYEVLMYCDLHAHSKSHNIFIYGIRNEEDFDKSVEEQVFFLMLHKNANTKFSYKNCRFKSGSTKKGFGRVEVGRMGISNSFTLEASFGGSELGDRSQTLFTFMDYEQMGYSFCKSVLDYYDDTVKKRQIRNKLKEQVLIENFLEAAENDDIVKNEESDKSTSYVQIIPQ